MVDGEPRRYRASIAEVAPAAAGLGAALRALDALAAELPADAPWDAPRAREWDGMTTAAWVAAEVADAGARDQLERWLVMLFTADLAEVSLLHTLFLIRSAGLDADAPGDPGRLPAGPPRRAARRRWPTGSPRSSATPSVSAPWCATSDRANGGVEVTGDGFGVRAARAIVAIPLALADGLRFSPPLPADRAQLQQRAPSGTVAKAVAVYESPFWREDGLSGESIDPGHPLSLTMDTSPPDDSRGVLTAFAYGPDARSFTRLPADERRRVALAGLLRALRTAGGRAGTPTSSRTGWRRS